GEADAIYAKMEAQARGMQEILQKQAAGFEKIVAAAGGDAKNAMMLMLADKMEDLMKIQVEAIRDLKIDKVTVWDSGNGTGTDGKSSTANFISGLMKSVPPMNEIFEMAGMNLPEFLGKKMDKPEDGAVVSAVDAKEIASDAKEVSDDAKEAEAVEAPKAFEAANVSEAAKAEDSAKAAAPAAQTAPAKSAAPAKAPAQAAPAAETQVPIWEKNPPMDNTQE
ncbi:MAG: hypothetical protein II657_06910, partial [Clostridiales bacterium]|nr:hypothetical protein [Clostridiales bacterium]